MIAHLCLHGPFKQAFGQLLQKSIFAYQILRLLVISNQLLKQFFGNSRACFSCTDMWWCIVAPAMVRDDRGHTKNMITVAVTTMRDGMTASIIMFRAGVCIGESQGSIECNAVRYYFTIQTFMHSSHVPENTCFSTSINKWYDLTARYKNRSLIWTKKTI